MRQFKIAKSITNRESSAVEKYLLEISREELLTPEEEVGLAKRIKQGDAVALDKLVRANLRFVVSVAKQYNNSAMQLNDIINEGNLGLVKAAKKFDETRGFKFISYAVWWIRQSIIQAIAEHGRQVRIPLNKVGATNKINKASNDFLMKHEREPSDEELAQITGLDFEHVLQVKVASLRTVSFDAPVEITSGDSVSRYDSVEDENIEQPDTKLASKESLQTEMRIALQILTPRERQVMQLIFGIDREHPCSLEDAGTIMNCTRERVRQIKDKALHKLSKNQKSVNLLKKYLGA